MRRSKLLSWKVWLGLGVSLLSIGLVLYDVQIDELLYRLRQVSFSHFLGGIILFFIYLIISAYRWQLILTPARCPSLVDSFSLLLIGRLVNNLLPLRAGEMVKVFLMSEKLNLSTGTTFASVILDRLLDVLSLLIVMVVLFFVIDIPVVVKQSAATLAIIVLSISIVMWLLSRRDKRIESLLWWCLDFTPLFLRKKINQLSLSFIDGIQMLQQSKLLLVVIFYSLLAWGFVTFSAWFFLEAVGLHLSWYVPLFLVVVTNLGGVVPASPGSIGVFHLLVVYSLSIWFVEKEAALTMAVVYHETIYIFVILLGLFFLWQEGYSLAKIQRFRATQVTQETLSI